MSDVLSSCVRLLEVCKRLERQVECIKRQEPGSMARRLAFEGLLADPLVMRIRYGGFYLCVGLDELGDALEQERAETEQEPPAQVQAQTDIPF